MLQQGEQSHLEVHFLPFEKHSQYNLRHFDFLQLQGLNSELSSERTSCLVLSFSDKFKLFVKFIGGNGVFQSSNDFDLANDFSSNTSAVLCRTSVE